MSVPDNIGILRMVNNTWVIARRDKDSENVYETLVWDIKHCPYCGVNLS
jgi:hypothetical protein